MAARELQQDIAKLKPGVVVTKPSVGARSNYIEFNAIPFFKAYACISTTRPGPAHEPYAQVVENQQRCFLSVQGCNARICSGDSLLLLGRRGRRTCRRAAKVFGFFKEF